MQRSAEGDRSVRNCMRAESKGGICIHMLMLYRTRLHGSAPRQAGRVFASYVRFFVELDALFQMRVPMSIGTPTSFSKGTRLHVTH